MDGSIGSYSNLALNPWTRYCCNPHMQTISNSSANQQALPSPYQHNSDLSYYSQAAQSSHLYPSFYQQSRFTLSSSLSPFHSHLTSCYESSSNDIGYRPLSTLPSIPDARSPFWYSSLESCASLYGNSFYRFFPSPSQASLPPISPSSDHFYPRTASLPSPFALSSAKNSHYCTDLSSSPSLVPTSVEDPTPDASEPLSVRVKTEPLTSATLLSPPVNQTARCFSPSGDRTTQEQIKLEYFNRDSEGYFVPSRFPLVSPSLKEAQLKNDAKSMKINNNDNSWSNSLQILKCKEAKQRSQCSAVVTPLQKAERKAPGTLKEVRKLQAISSEREECSNAEKPKPLKSSAIHLPKFTSECSSMKNTSDEQDEPICYVNRVSSISESDKKPSETNGLSGNLKKHKQNKSNPSSQVPIGIAVARKRQTSPLCKRSSIETLTKTSSVDEKHTNEVPSKEEKSREINNNPRPVSIKPNSSIIESNTPAMTITPDYRLARDAVTGQFYLISTTASFLQNQLISNSAPGIPTVGLVNNSVPNADNIAIESEDDVSVKKVVEQATQACLSDEENELMNNNNNNCVTSSVQVDMDADDEHVVSEKMSQLEEIKENETSVAFNESNPPANDLVLNPSSQENAELESMDDSLNKKTDDRKLTVKSGNSALCTEGLKLLSALAEQRSLEEKRRHSADCLLEVPASERCISDDLTKPVKKRQRSESCISAIALPKPDPSNSPHFSPIEGGVRKKRKYCSSSDPWMIRRSERIFLNESLQQSQNTANTHYSGQKCKVSLSRKSRKRSKDERKSTSDIESEQRSNEDESPVEEKNENAISLFSESFAVKENLLNNQRIIIKIDDLLYAGSVSPIQAPDVYGITLDGERSQKKHIYSREDVLKEAIIEIKPTNIKQLPEGTRVCAYWSQQYKCLYAGRVAVCASPNPLPERNLVFVEFDDGDKGRISLNDIRLLPPDYPLVVAVGDNRQNYKRTKVDDEKEQQEAEKETMDTSSVDSSDVKNDETSNESTNRPKRKRKHCKDAKKHHKRHKHRHCKHHKKKRKHKKKDVEINKKLDHSQELSEQIENRKGRKAVSEGKSHLSSKRAQRRRERISSSEKSKIAPFLPLQQLWHWSGKCFRKVGTKGRTKKEFYKAIHRGKEVIKVGDSAVFLSTGRPNLPYVGKIDSMWQSGNGSMVVKVKWFYHPEETKVKPDLVDARGALFESSHYDENDVQTISHKCEVLQWEEYESRRARKPDISLDDPPNVYYMGGTYEPLAGKLHIASKVPLRRSLNV